MSGLKRNFLLFALLLSFGTQAQRWYVGPEMGFNIINIESTELGNDFQLGFNGGGNVEYRFTDYFSLRSGIFATQKRQTYGTYDSVLVNLFGFEDQIGIDGINLYSYTRTTARVSQLFLEIPVMPTFTYKAFSIYAGPAIGYMLTARTREKTEINTPFRQAVDVDEIDPTGGTLAALLPPAESTTYSESSSKSGLWSIDYAVKGGIRYSLNNLGINLNYVYSFLDFRTAKPYGGNHQFVQLTLNYNFGLVKK